MKNKNRRISNIILALGSLFLFIGFTSFLLAISSESPLTEYLFSALVLFFGIIFMYLYITFFRKNFHFIIGLSCILTGIMLMLMQTGIIPLTIEETWPLSLLFVAISIFTLGKIKFRKIVFSYDFSALFLFALSIFYSLFSFNIIKIPFRQSFIYIIPVLIFLGGAFLIFLFIHRQKINDILKSSDSDLDDGDIENF